MSIFPRFELPPEARAELMRQCADGGLSITDSHIMTDLMVKAVGDAIEKFEEVIERMPNLGLHLSAKVNGIAWLAMHAHDLTQVSIAATEALGIQPADHPGARAIRKRFKGDGW